MAPAMGENFFLTVAVAAQWQVALGAVLLSLLFRAHRPRIASIIDACQQPRHAVAVGAPFIAFWLHDRRHRRARPMADAASRRVTLLRRWSRAGLM
jgi:hypothetical protein